MQINFHIYQGCQLFVPRVYDYMSHTKYVIQRKQDILGNIVQLLCSQIKIKILLDPKYHVKKFFYKNAVLLQLQYNYSIMQ